MKPNILLIADDIDSLTLLSTAVKTPNYNPVWAGDGMQSISTARRYEPEANLLDLGLQGGDGVSVLERLQSNRMPSREHAKYSGIHRR